MLVRTPTEHKPVMEGSTKIIEISDDTPAESSTEDEQCDRDRMTLTEGQLADKPVVEEISPVLTINYEKRAEKLKPKELQERECLSQKLGACCYQRVGNQTMHSEVKNVQWTQCNSCHGWLHTECAGIDLGLATHTSFNCGCHVKLPYCLKRTRAAAEKGMLESILTDEEIQNLADDLKTGVLQSNRIYLKRHPNFNFKFKENREALISIFNEKQTTAIIDRVDTVLGRDKKNLEQLSFHLDVMTPEVTLCILQKLEGFSRYEAEKAFVSHVYFEGED
ncbi:uncharacterized protein [Pseudorasbora parva]|uniref:uncharacterized protein n=1 Tax=Pseudorasbora parva TaxID=51549 RepID=UPI00351E1622